MLAAEMPFFLSHLDGDEVSLALVGNGLGQKSFPATRGPVEQNPLRGGHPKLEELLRVLHRVLHGCVYVYV